MNMLKNTNMKAFVEADLITSNSRIKEKHELGFIVVPNQFACLLWLDNVQKLKLITINDDRFISNVSSNNLSHLGSEHLHVDSNLQPKVLP